MEGVEFKQSAKRMNAKHKNKPILQNNLFILAVSNIFLPPFLPFSPFFEYQGSFSLFAINGKGFNTSPLSTKILLNSPICVFVR